MISARGITLWTLVALAVPSVAFANPVSLTGGYSLIAIPFLLVLEGVLIALLARDSAVYLLRFVPVWTVITTITFVLLLLLVSTVSGSPANTVIDIAGEIVVVLMEALCIVFLLARASLARNPKAAPSLRKALAYSFIANLVSLVGGLLAGALM